ncbi:MAG: hypothetical protein HC895_03990 [Leptolyngbyaceae cyanobacterium SM1_3_5]|nr:hypothetical protein [Leptolyngbyaceae cyanobacterium SM1_3_5]
MDGEQTDYTDRSPAVGDSRRAIAYSMDALVPGLYFWFGKIAIRIGGSPPETNYPGTIHSFAGAALVLPGYRIYSTYQGSYDPR